MFFLVFKLTSHHTRLTVDTIHMSHLRDCEKYRDLMVIGVKVRYHLMINITDKQTISRMNMHEEQGCMMTLTLVDPEFPTFAATQPFLMCSFARQKRATIVHETR